MSMFSAAFSRFQGAISSAVSLVPFVGGLASKAVDSIHTGDVHQDASGAWVLNSTGVPAAQSINPQLQAEVDKIDAYRRDEAERARQVAADAAARVGIGVSREVAARLGPEGNVYAEPFKSPMVLGAIALVVVILFLAMRGGRR